MSWLFGKRLRPFVMLAAAASFLLNLALLMPSIYMMQVFDRVLSSRSEETLVMLSVLTLGALSLAYFMDTARANVLAWSGRALERFLAPLALAQSFRHTGNTAARPDSDSLRDISLLRSFLSSNGILALFDAPWLPLYLLVIALMHPVLGVLATAGACLLVATAMLTERFTRSRAHSAMHHSRTAQQQAEALMRNSEVIVGMGMTAAATARWQIQHEAGLEAQAGFSKVSVRLSAVARLIRQMLQIAMLGLGAWLVIETQSSPGIMIAATILLSRALHPVEQLISGWKAMLDARGAWQRLTERAAPRVEASIELPAPRGRLEVERVVYGFESGRPPLIKGVSFAIAAGESVGVIGHSASGKTTLIRLMLGITQPQSGVVRLDGADIAQWNRSQLGSHIGYLPQDVELFTGTVAENIARLALGSGVDSRRVIEAAHLAHAHEMILRLPQGYETQIGQGGLNQGGSVLSGGQRQRIALARALFGNPRFVVLDEPNANLDADGDAALSNALKDLKAGGTTVVVVGHRSGLMAQLDKLVLMKDGAIEGFDRSETILPQLRSIPKSPPRLTAVTQLEARA